MQVPTCDNYSKLVGEEYIYFRRLSCVDFAQGSFRNHCFLAVIFRLGGFNFTLGHMQVADSLP